MVAVKDKVHIVLRIVNNNYTLAKIDDLDMMKMTTTTTTTIMIITTTATTMMLITNPLNDDDEDLVQKSEEPI